MVRRHVSVTLKDVARHANVGQATAARALGSYGRINPATRDRVLAAADELGYRTNALARSMVTRSTRTLGLVVSDIENFFFARIARAVTDVARAQGYDVLLLNTDENVEREIEAVRVLFEKRVDGIIVVPCSSTESGHLVPLLERHIPIVLLDRPIAGVAADTVLVNNFAASWRAVNYLTTLGHRRIGLLTGGVTTTTGAERLAGYRQALADVGVTDVDRWIRISDGSRSNAQSRTAQLLDLPAAIRPTAVFATDSIITAGTLFAIQARDLEMPAEISLVGFDDVDWMSMVRPRITVVEQPVYTLGKQAAERLISRLTAEEDEIQPRHYSLETDLIVRDSCAPPTKSPGS